MLDLKIIAISCYDNHLFVSTDCTRVACASAID